MKIHMNKSKLILPLVPLLILSIIFIGCFKEEIRFVEGPETNNLTEMATGYLIVNQSWDSAEPDPPRILAISLPDLKQTVVRQRGKDWLWTVSGPDNKGRIAFVEGNNKKHRLKTIYLDGSREELIFERPGDPISDNVIGEHLAISPTGGLIAFISQGTYDQNPGAYLPLGSIEIWDVTKKTGYDTGIIAIDDWLWWSPDGKELAYVALVKREQIPKEYSLPGSPYGEEHEKEYGRWENYPVVYILNIETNQSRILHPGWHPVFSVDWDKALVYSRNIYLIDIKTGQPQPFDYPSSSWSMPRFLLPNNLAIFLKQPTVGTTPRWLKRGSFSVGSSMWAIKLGDIDTWKFQTVLPYWDFRDELSFGIVKHSLSPEKKGKR
jgi:hypothetical protein